MKTLALLLMFGFATFCQAYTYDGWIDPKEFGEWEKEYLGVMEMGKEEKWYMDVFKCTCDGLEAIVGIINLNNGTPIIYMFAYYISDTEYLFVLEDGHYKQVLPEKVISKKPGTHI